MFSNLLSLIIVLLLVSIAIDSTLHPLSGSPALSFTAGILGYLSLLILIYVQTTLLSRYRKGMLLVLVNLELIIFLAYFHFVLGAHRFIENLPYFKGLQTPISLFSLILYFGGLGVFHYSYFRLKNSPSNTSWMSSTWLQLRFLIPFVIPFLLFTLFLDLLKFMPNESVQDLLINKSENPVGSLALFIFSLFFMIMMMIFLPLLIQRIWGCEDLEDIDLKNRLEDICHRAQFKHAGFKTWGVMNDSLTAAIIGIVPRFRYIMFTKRLLERLSPEAIVAILTHEIGHSYRKHLLIYPVIIFGMIVTCGLFSLFFSEGLTRYLELKNFLYPSLIWEMLHVFMVFIPYALIIALYFRYIFGYFSRTFERQADLHGFVLNLPPEYMIEALNDVAIATGYTHHQPSWHHYSIQERIDFLENAKHNPALIAKHHHKARISLYAYLIALGMALSLLMAPLMPAITPFKQMTAFSEAISNGFNRWLNGSLQEQAAEKLIKLEF